MRLSFFCCALLSGLLASAGVVVAQAPPAPSVNAVKPAQGARPIWSELSAAQRDALSPLAGTWETLAPERKRKWLDIAARYPKLTPDAQQRVHQRMAEYARLSPEQRETARKNFRSAYELPADERQEKLQRYRELPDDKKRALAEQAAKKQAAPASTIVPAPTK